jgi:hypothetical protein
MKSFITKLAAGTFVTFSLAGVAHAAQVIVFEKPFDGPGRQVGADFDLNRDLGRAWIDVVIQGDDYVADEPPQPDVVVVRVEGLYYDRTLKQVLYRTGSDTVVCAEDVSFLWFTRLKNTGNCQLTASTEQRKSDDGFNVSDHAVAKVFLDVQSASGSRQAFNAAK